MHEIDPMTEDRPRPTPRLPNPGHLEERPWWVLPVLIVWIVLVLAGYLAMTYAWDTTEPAPAPSPSPSSRPWSEDCTAEELNTGVCYLTWDHIRDQPTYTQAP